MNTWEKYPKGKTLGTQLAENAEAAKKELVKRQAREIAERTMRMHRLGLK